jgi:hypothetical protein
MSFVKKIYILVIFCLVGSIPLQAQKPNYTDLKFSEPAIEQTKIAYRIIDAPNKTFCYDIFVDDRLLIHQPSIPGLPGIKGFVRKRDAEKVAALVIKKIKNGIMPPTIEAKELDSLEIKFKHGK